MDERALPSHLWSALDQADIGVAFLDTELRYRYLNAYAATLFENSPGELIGRSLEETVAGSFGRGSGREVAEEFEGVLRTGTPYFAHAWSSPMRPEYYSDWDVRRVDDPDGKPLGVILIVHDVSEHVRTDRALEESTERLHLATQAANVGTWDWDIPTDRDIWDDQAKALFGLSAGQDVTHSVFINAIHPDDRGRVEEAISAALDTHQEFEVEYRVALPDGAVRWIHDRGHAHYEAGKPIRMTGVVMDITERKRAEQALQDSEEKYRTLFNTMSEGFALCEMILDADGVPCDFRYLDVNPAFEEHTGLRADQAVGNTVREILPNIEPYWIENYGQVALTGQPIRVENYLQDLDRYFEVFAFRPTAGRFAAIFMDVSERKKAEEETHRLLAAVQQEKDRLSALVNSISDEVWFADTQKRFTLANPSALREFGLGSADGIDVEKLAESLEAYRPDGSPRPAEEAPALRALDGEVVRGEEEIVRTPAGGELRYRQVSSAPVKDGDGNIIGSVSVARDITKRVRAEDRVRHQNEVLSGINRIFREALTTSTEEELGATCLAVAEEVTQSKFGFMGEMSPEGKLDDIAMSDPGWDACRMETPAGHGKVPLGFKVHGIYGRVILDGKGFYTNDPVSHPDSIGTPEGHPLLTGFLGVPLIRDGEVIGMVGIGNREGGYRDEDLEALEALAPVIVQAFVYRRSEQELRESEQRLSRTQEIAHLGSWELDLAEDKLSWSDEVYRIFGTTPEEFGGTNEAFLDAVHPEDREAVDEAYKSSLREGRSSYETEHRIVRRNTGEIRWVRERCEHIRDSSGRVIRSTGMVLDITERKQAEQALMWEEEHRLEFYRRLIIASTNGKLLITDANEIAEVAGPAEESWKIAGPDDLAVIRHGVTRAAECAGMEALDVGRFALVAGEAITNALKHAGGGRASLHHPPNSMMIVVEDDGPGIAAVNLPDVALRKSYSTAGSLGVGYKLITALSDKVYLATGSDGTTVAIEMTLHPSGQLTFECDLENV